MAEDKQDLLLKNLWLRINKIFCEKLWLRINKIFCEKLWLRVSKILWKKLVAEDKQDLM